MSLTCALGLGAVVAPRAQPASPALHRPRRLARLEEEIARNPFAPPSALRPLTEALAARRSHRSLQEMLPPPERPKTPDNGGMGWAQPDAEYWQAIPPDARAIPRDWSRLPVVRFTNTELDGAREVRLNRKRHYDQWLLKDPLHNLTACIAIHRATHRVYFMEVSRQKGGTWGMKRAKDLCYSCHPSGLRVIRPLQKPGLDRRALERFNRLLLSYGAGDFGNSVDVKQRGEPYADLRCRTCHDGKRRGKLYAIHQRPITFKTEHELTMPPERQKG